MSRLSNVISDSLRHCPEKECLADPLVRFTFRELESFINGTAQNLINIGIRKNDHIAVAVENSAIYIIVYLALLKVGAIVVPIDVTLNKNNVDFIVDDCSVKHIVYSDFTRDLVGKNGLFLQDLVENSDRTVDVEDVAEEDTACILYTTGSTGFPKGVVLRHRNVYASLANISKYIKYNSNFRELVPLPLTHSFGLNQVLSNLLNGGFAYIIKGFGRIKQILNILEQEQMTCFPGTPTSFRLVMDKYLEHFKKAGKSLTDIIINSSPLPPKDASLMLKELPNINLIIYYGLTEVSRSTFHTHSLDLDEKYLSSVGTAAPNVEVAIMDSEGNHLGPNKEGEVIVNSGTLLKEYWNDPELTEKSTINGWFRTGDQGYLDEAGYLFLTGRLKDQINIGGLKVTAQEIIRAIESFNEVEEAFVFGVHDDLNGEVPIAFAVLEKNITKDDLLSRLSNTLETFKLPRELYFVDKIPKSETGKILKSKIVDMHKKMTNNA